MSSNIISSLVDSVFNRVRNVVENVVSKTGTKIAASIPGPIDLVKQSITVTRNQVKGTSNNIDGAQAALVSTATTASGIISTVGWALISVVVSVVFGLILLFIIPCTRNTLEVIGKRAQRFTRETIRELKQVFPNPLVYLCVVILSIPYAFLTAVFIPFIKNLQFYIIALVIILIWLYIFEFNKESTVQFIDHMTRTTMMGTNIGLKLFDYGVQITNLGLPIYNDAVHGSVNTIIAIYDALAKQSLFDIDLADLDENVDITTISNGRLLAIKPAKRLSLNSKIQKTIITYIGLNQIQVSLSAVVIGIALGSGLGPILVRALVIFFTIVVKLFCTIVDFPCAILEYTEFVFNLFLLALDRLLDIFRTIIPFKQLGPLRFACGEKDFLSLTPSQCAGGVATVNPPGLFQGLLKKTSRRLEQSVLSCDYFDGSFVEYYQTNLLHQTTNDTLACEHVYKALSGKLQALLVFEKIDYTEECIDVCHLGTLIQICPEQEQYVKIIGRCIQPLAKKKRRLIKKFKYGGMFKPVQSVQTNHTETTSTSKFRFMQDLKATVPIEFHLDGFECNLNIQNTMDIYEIATNLGCLAAYVMKSKNIDYKSIFGNFASQDVHVRRVLTEYNNQFELFNKHRFRQFMHYSTSNDDIVDYFVPKIIPIQEQPRRELQNKKSPWMMPCPSSTDPNQILCFTDMKTCATDYSNCPELNLDNAPSELQYIGYQYTKLMSALDSFEPVDYVSTLNDCWREYRDPSKDPMKKVNLEKPIEQQILLTYCPPMVKPTIWQPEFVQVSATGLVDTYICQSTTQFDGCYCPGYYDSNVLIKYYEGGAFSPYIIYVFSNGLLSIWYLLTNVAPISVIMTAFVPADTIAHWNVINSDLTAVERGICFAIHFGSLGMTLWIAAVVYLFANMVAKIYLISERYLFMDQDLEDQPLKKD